MSTADGAGGGDCQDRSGVLERMRKQQCCLMPAMRNSLTSFVLLLVLSFGLVAGHLPCRAQEDSQEAEMSDPQAGMTCHASEAPAEGPALYHGSSASGHGCCSDEHGFCQHACHMVADMGAVLPRFAVQMSARVLLAPVYRSLSLHPQPIDHIPLT